MIGDTESRNLTGVSENVVDIIYVHGIGSWTSCDPWTSEPDEISAWIREPHEYACVRDLNYTWKESRPGASALDNLDEAAESLLKEIEELTAGQAEILDTSCSNTQMIPERCQQRPLMFVAHSLGGIVVQKALLLAQSHQNWGSIAGRTFGLNFLNVPHNVPKPNAPENAWMGTISSLELVSWREVIDAFQQVAGIYSINYFCNEDCVSESGVEILHSDCFWGRPCQTPTFSSSEHHYIRPHSLAPGEVNQAVQLSVDIMSEAAVKRANCHIENIETQRTYKDMLADKRSPNTCDWILNHESFRRWSDCREVNALWIHGAPGSGKSVVCATLTDHLVAENESTRTNILSLFRTMDKISDPAIDFLSTLVSHLQQATWKISTNLALQLVLADIEKSTSAISSGQLNEHLRKIFTNLGRKTKLILIIDGWDECLTNTVIYQLNNVNNLRRHEQRIRCVIASRSLLPKEWPRRSIAVIDTMETSGHRNDIRRFVNGKLSSMDHFSADSLQKSSLTEQICSRAAGVFLWASLITEKIGQCPNAAEVRKVIQTFPVSLADCYEHILSSIVPEQSARAAAVIMWVVGASRPLTRLELLDAMAISEGSAGDTQSIISDAIAACGGLVVVAPDHKLRFVHSSVRDYLSRSEEKGSPGSTVIQCHEMIAKACLKYLTIDRSCCLLSSAGLHRNVEKNGDKLLLRGYVVDSWLFHYRIAERHSKTLAGTLQSHLRHEYSVHHMKTTQASFDREIAQMTLHFAIRHGLDSLAQIQIESGAGSEESFCKKCLSPLALAAAMGRGRITKLLLRGELSPSNISSRGNTPLQFAIKHADFDIVQELISCGADIGDMTCQPAISALTAAVSGGNVDIVKLLSEAYPDSLVRSKVENTTSYYGQTLLHLAATSGSLSVTAFLIDGLDMDPNAMALYETVTQQASFQSWSDDVLQNLSTEEQGLLNIRMREIAEGDIRQLTSRSVKIYGVDAKDQKGRTPLHYAAMYGHEEIVQLLLLRGATCGVRDYLGRSALQHAAENGHLSTVKQLLAMGAPKQPSNETLGSLVGRVYKDGHEKVANMLLIDSYVTEVTGKGCGWQTLELIANSERSPVRHAISKKSQKDNKRHRRGIGLPLSSKYARETKEIT